MSKFYNKTTTIRIQDNKENYSLICDECETMNYIGGNAYAICGHIYKVLLNTLLSMAENNCKVIKINASWEKK